MKIKINRMKMADNCYFNAAVFCNAIPRPYLNDPMKSIMVKTPVKKLILEKFFHSSENHTQLREMS